LGRVRRFLRARKVRLKLGINEVNPAAFGWGVGRDVFGANDTLIAADRRVRAQGGIDGSKERGGCSMALRL
jgi:hypothetical protein